MRTTFSPRFRAFAVFALLTVSACGLPPSAPGSSPSLTSLPAATEPTLPGESGSATPVVLRSPSPVSAVTPALRTATLPAVTSGTPAATEICDLALAGSPIDITIPDDTRMAPNQSFTKTWRLKNGGACTWSHGYSAAFFSGERMGAAKSVPLPDEVPPGESVDISVDMTSPKVPGKFQGNWKLLNASQEWFGIGPDGSASFWVRIIVPPQPTASPTPRPPEPPPPPQPTDTAELPSPTPTQELTPTITPGPEFTPTLTPTLTVTATLQPTAAPAPQAVTLSPGFQLDLDRSQLNPDGGADLAMVIDQAGQHLLAPLGETRLALFSASQPTEEDCRNLPLGIDAFTAEQLPAGAYLCFQTGEGALGWLQVQSVSPGSPDIRLRLLAWAAH